MQPLYKLNEAYTLFIPANFKNFQHLQNYVAVVILLMLFESLIEHYSKPHDHIWTLSHPG